MASTRNPLSLRPSTVREDTQAHLLSQRPDTAINLRKRTDRQHFFHSALGHHLRFAAFILDNGGQTPAGKIKGDLVHLDVVLRQIHQPWIFSLCLLGPADNCQIHQVLVSGLEVAVEIRMAQNPGIIIAVDIEMILQNHLILGESAGLIGAENIDCPEILDGVEVFDDGLLLAHGHSALGKAGGYDHGEHFRSQTDGNGNAQTGMPPANPLW